jgi:3-isopropylmalate dehydrogenase
MSRRIVVLAGDGVGPEVTEQAVRVLHAVAVSHGLELTFEDALIGGAAYDAVGVPLPDATVAACKRSAGILLGAVGGPKWSDIPVQHRPEQGLLAIRKALGLFANLRLVTTVPSFAASP